MRGTPFSTNALNFWHVRTRPFLRRTSAANWVISAQFVFGFLFRRQSKLCESLMSFYRQIGDTIPKQVTRSDTFLRFERRNTSFIVIDSPMAAY
jgi:hypothetical protein